MAAAASMEKRLEAESVTLLKSLLEMELRRVREDFGFDISMLIGVDGRIFATSIPDVLAAPQYRLLNLVKANLPNICAQLTTEAMRLSLTQYEHGVVLISPVGGRAFLVLLSDKVQDVAAMGPTLANVRRASTVLQHVFQQRPMSAEALAGYDPETAEELRRLSRRLFVEKFDETPQYRRNMDIHNYLKQELTQAVGVGSVDEFLSHAYAEVGTSAPYMKDNQWARLLDLLIARVRTSGGDVLAQQCEAKWVRETKRRLKAFV
jgi:predicted regulator of Ras-like GTPase activity (Roadblock/LC7/MglB family)